MDRQKGERVKDECYQVLFQAFFSVQTRESIQFAMVINHQHRQVNDKSHVVKDQAGMS